jgi:hypothetical protein
MSDVISFVSDNEVSTPPTQIVEVLTVGPHNTQWSIDDTFSLATLDTSGLVRMQNTESSLGKVSKHLN